MLPTVELLDLLDGRLQFDAKTEMKFVISDLWNGVLSGRDLELFFEDKAPACKMLLAACNRFIALEKTRNKVFIFSPHPTKIDSSCDMFQEGEPAVIFEATTSEQAAVAIRLFVCAEFGLHSTFVIHRVDIEEPQI